MKKLCIEIFMLCFGVCAFAQTPKPCSSNGVSDSAYWRVTVMEYGSSMAETRTYAFHKAQLEIYLEVQKFIAEMEKDSISESNHTIDEFMGESEVICEEFGMNTSGYVVYLTLQVKKTNTEKYYK